MHAVEYELLSKDTTVLHFCCKKTEYGELAFSILSWEAPELAPIGFFYQYQQQDVQNSWLESFLESRKAPKHREHIAEVLERYGCADLKGFLDVSHAVSLNDTFWVRQAGSALVWDNVSLYRNEFDQLVSLAAFDGTFSSTELSSSTPELGTDGQYAKCWSREGGEVYLYKRASPALGTEHLSEYLASQVAEKVCPGAVQYDLSLFHEKLASKCALFTTEQLGLAKAARIFRGQKKSIAELLAYFESIGSGDAFRRMCVLDALILNDDRHYGNFGVLFDTDTMQVLRMAPVFDLNRALLPALDEDQLANPEWYIQRCQSKLGGDFTATAQTLMSASIRADMEALLEFRFRPHPCIPLPDERVRLLELLVRRRAEEILTGKS